MVLCRLANRNSAAPKVSSSAASSRQGHSSRELMELWRIFSRCRAKKCIKVPPFWLCCGFRHCHTAAARSPRSGLPAFRRWQGAGGTPAGAGAGCRTGPLPWRGTPRCPARTGGCFGGASRCKHRTAADSSAAQTDSPQWHQRRRWTPAYIRCRRQIPDCAAAR